MAVEYQVDTGGTHKAYCTGGATKVCGTGTGGAGKFTGCICDEGCERIDDWLDC